MNYLAASCFAKKSSWWRLMAPALFLILAMRTVSGVSMRKRSTTTLENCLRKQLSPPPPPPPAGSPSAWIGIMDDVICKDEFRIEGFYLRLTGKLAPEYLEALCNIYEDDQQQVNQRIATTYADYDYRSLLDGRTCESIRNQHDSPSPSSILLE